MDYLYVKRKKIPIRYISDRSYTHQRPFYGVKLRELWHILTLCNIVKISASFPHQESQLITIHYIRDNINRFTTVVLSGMDSALLFCQSRLDYETYHCNVIEHRWQKEGF
jgi:hypothetical protein